MRCGPIFLYVSSNNLIGSCVVKFINWAWKFSFIQGLLLGHTRGFKLLVAWESYLVWRRYEFSFKRNVLYDEKLFFQLIWIYIIEILRLSRKIGAEMCWKFLQKFPTILSTTWVELLLMKYLEIIEENFVNIVEISKIIENLGKMWWKLARFRIG